MPTYDPTLRSVFQVLSTGGLTTASISVPTHSDGDRIIVGGRVGSKVQINAPDATWTRLTTATTYYQAFTKIANGEPSSWVFSWDGTAQAYVFEVYVAYSAANGTVSVDSTIPAFVNSNGTTATSNPVTPSQNALVIVDYNYFLNAYPQGAPGLTQILLARGHWGGDIYIAASTNSGTFTCTGAVGQGNVDWGVGTFPLISSLPNPIIVPFLDDDLIFTPTIAGAATSKAITVPFIDDELVFAPVVTSPSVRPVVPLAPRKFVVQMINAGGWIAQGSTRVVRVQLTDITGVYVTDRPVGTPIPVGPPANVLITLISPSQRLIVNQAVMSPDPNITGNYFYRYDVAASDETGRWLAQFSFNDGMGNTGLASPRPLWTVTTQ